MNVATNTPRNNPDSTSTISQLNVETGTDPIGNFARDQQTSTTLIPADPGTADDRNRGTEPSFEDFVILENPRGSVAEQVVAGPPIFPLMDGHSQWSHSFHYGMHLQPPLLCGPDMFTEFRQNLILGTTINPIWSSDTFVEREVYLPSLPQLLTIVESVVHFANQAYTTSLRGQWVPGIAQFPIAQHICICLDNGQRRYEAVFRIAIIRSHEDRFIQSQKTLRDSGVEVQHVGFRTLRSCPSRTPNFRSMLRRSLEKNASPILKISPFEMVVSISSSISRASGRNLSMDESIHQFMTDQSGFMTSHFYPLVEHCVQKYKFKLPGAAFYATGYFYRPYMSTACILTSNGSLQLADTVDVRISFQNHRLLGFSYESTIGKVFGAGRGVGVTSMSSTTYVEPWLTDSDRYNSWGSIGENTIPVFPINCHPFHIMDMNPIFNPGFNPYLSQTFVAPLITTLKVPDQDDLNPFVTQVPSCDVPALGYPLRQRPIAFIASNTQQQHLSLQTLAPSGVINIPISQESSFDVVEPVHSGAEGDASSKPPPPSNTAPVHPQIPLTTRITSGLNPNARDFFPRGMSPPPSKDTIFPTDQPTETDANTLEEQADAKTVDRSEIKVSTFNLNANPHPRETMTQPFRLLTVGDNPVPVVQPICLLNVGPFHLSVSSQFAESEDELILEEHDLLNRRQDIEDDADLSTFSPNCRTRRANSVDRNHGFTREIERYGVPSLPDHGFGRITELALNQSWSQQMEDHTFHESDSQISPPAPVRASISGLSSSALDGRRTRRGSVRGRGGYEWPARGGRGRWGNYDGDNYRIFHNSDMADRSRPSFPMRGGRGRSRGSRGRGRGRGYYVNNSGDEDYEGYAENADTIMTGRTFYRSAPFPHLPEAPTSNTSLPANSATQPQTGTRSTYAAVLAGGLGGAGEANGVIIDATSEESLGDAIYNFGEATFFRGGRGRGRITGYRGRYPRGPRHDYYNRRDNVENDQQRRGDPSPQSGYRRRGDGSSNFTYERRNSRTSTERQKDSRPNTSRGNRPVDPTNGQSTDPSAKTSDLKVARNVSTTTGEPRNLGDNGKEKEEKGTDVPKLDLGQGSDAGDDKRVSTSNKPSMTSTAIGGKSDGGDGIGIISNLSDDTGKEKNTGYGDTKVERQGMSQYKLDKEK